MFAGPFHNLVLAVLFFTIVLVGFGVPGRRRRSPPCPPACCPPARSATRGPLPVRSPPTGSSATPGTRLRPAGAEPRRRRPGCGPATRSSRSTATRSTRRPTSAGRRCRTAIRQQPRHPARPHDRARRRSGGPHGHADRQHGLRRRGELRRRSPSATWASAPRRPTSGSRSPTSRLPRHDVVPLGGQAGARSRSGCRSCSAPRSSARSATRTDRSASSASAGSPVRCSPSTSSRTTEKISYFFQLLAGVNLVLFLFNLLPIYPLDGGHVAGALYEKARATVARVRGRPDPGPFDIARLMPVAYVVAGCSWRCRRCCSSPTSSTRSRWAEPPVRPVLRRPAGSQRRPRHRRRAGILAAWRSLSASACRLHPLPSSPPGGRPASSTWAVSASAATSRSACSR